MSKFYKKIIAFALMAAIILVMPLTAFASSETAETQTVAVREFFEAHDAVVTWDGARNQVIITLGGHDVRFYIGGEVVYVDGMSALYLSTPVVLAGGTAFMYQGDAYVLLTLLTVGIPIPGDEPLAYGQLAYRLLHVIEEYFPSRIAYTQRERDTAEWIMQELINMGHDPANVYLQEFGITPMMAMTVADINQMDPDAEELPDNLLWLGVLNIYTPEDILQHTFLEYSQNVILTIPGQSERRIIVGAHYDSPNSPGISDNAGGIVMLMESAYRMLSLDHYYTITYIFFGAEEVGLIGAFYYVSQLTDECIENIALMINIDVIFDGFSHTFGVGYYCFEAGGESSNQVTEVIMGVAEALNEEYGLEFIHEPYGIFLSSDQQAFIPLEVQILTFYSVNNFEPWPMYIHPPNHEFEPFWTNERFELILAILDGTEDEELLAAIEADREMLDEQMALIATLPLEIIYMEIEWMEELLEDPDWEEWLDAVKEQLGWLDFMLEIIAHPAFEHDPTEWEFGGWENAFYLPVNFDEYGNYDLVRLVYIGDGIYQLDENYYVIHEDIFFMEYLGDGLFRMVEDWEPMPWYYPAELISYEVHEDGSITYRLYLDGEYHYVTHEWVDFDQWRMGLVLHTLNDNLVFLNENFPGLVERALYAYSKFLEWILTLPGGSL